MELLTAAIVAAVAAGVTRGAGSVGESLVMDAYKGLKDLLRRKHGEDSGVAQAVEELEARPDSEARQQVLAEEVAVSGAGKDPELLRAAENLIERLQAEPGGESHVQQAVGNYIAQADRSGHAEVHVDRPADNSRD
ncbi:hypothetical protein ACIPYQ_38780 [Streptomyces sp. NPDC090045]|uniref:hypothetical protein n=1 Tax=Streptomyces sp. NPDC090045 TaxID=3365927 RepID=UPI0038213F8E